jgi:hypothetical protein
MRCSHERWNRRTITIVRVTMQCLSQQMEGRAKGGEGWHLQNRILSLFSFLCCFPFKQPLIYCFQFGLKTSLFMLHTHHSQLVTNAMSSKRLLLFYVSISGNYFPVRERRVSGQRWKQPLHWFSFLACALIHISLLQQPPWHLSMRDSATSAMRGWEHENPGKTGWLRVGAISGSADFTGKLRISTFRLKGSHFVYEKSVPNKPQNKKLLIWRDIFNNALRY